MKAFFLIFLTLCALAGGRARGENRDEEAILPQWTEEDWERLQEGNIVPGSSLLGDAARHQLFGDLEDPVIPEFDIPEPGPEPEGAFPTEIGTEFLPGYFREKPTTFLNDPQGLLTMQERRDREGFLDYHAKDSEIDLFFYIFDAKQELPEGESAESLVRRFFPDNGKVALVAYFMGMPERTQIAYSPEVSRLVSQKSRRDSLRLAVEEALEKSDPTSQLESFSIQLSIRIYWMERELEKAARRQGQSSATGSAGNPLAGGEEKGSMDRLQFIYHVLLWTFSATVVFFLAWIGRKLAERKRKYYFPPPAEPPVLGAAHAAGGGGTLHYRSLTEPPSSQKDEVPDYLAQL